MNTYKTICSDAEACSISEDIAKRPLYYTLPIDDIKGIAENVKEGVR